MEYRFKTGVIAGIPTDETITVGFEDGTALTFGKSYWLGSSDPAAGMTVSVMFNRDMGIMGCNETVAVPRRETATDGAGAAENAGDVKNKAAPRSERNTYKGGGKTKETTPGIKRKNPLVTFIEMCQIKNWTTEGRATVYEYGSFFVMWTILAFLPTILGEMLKAGRGIDKLLEILTHIYLFATILPLWAVSVRRLHDIGSSGWWLVVICPFIFTGSFFLLLLPGNPYTNKYGRYRGGW